MEKKNIFEVKHTIWIIPRTTIKINPKRKRLNIILPDNTVKVSLICDNKDFTLDDFLDNLLKAITEYNTARKPNEQG